MYPFDTQLCIGEMMLPWKNNHTVALKPDDDAIKYEGPTILKEFEILDVTCNSSIITGGSIFQFNIKMRRVGFSAFNGIFIQTFLLWFLVYLTLFIDVHDFNDRFMGALTGFLVLAALTPNIMDMVPPAADFKLIDLWSMFFNINIVSIILSHIVIDALIKRPQVFINKSSETCCKNSGLVANNVAKVLFPMVTLGFVATYFIYFM